MKNLTKIIKAKFFILLLCAPALMIFSLPAHAACGGLNQKACPVYKKGPPCRTWLRKVKKVCRPCGGLNQRACPIIKKGKSCKSGLSRKLGKCVKAKKNVKGKLLKDARARVQRLKPVIRQIASTLRKLNNKKMIRQLKAALKSNNPAQLQRVLQEFQQRAIQNALYKAGFRTTTIGVQSSVALAGGYGREIGAAQDVFGKSRISMYVSKTYFGGAILGVGNDLVFSAFSSSPNNIGGALWAAIGNFDVGSGVGVVIWYDKRTLLIKGISVGIGIGSVGAGGAVGHGTTYMCPSRACEKVF